MRPSFKKFIIRISILSALLYLLWAALIFILPASLLSPAIPVMIAFFMIITAGIYYMMLQSASNRFPRFVNSFMVVTVGKILLFAVLIVIYALANRADAAKFITAFFVLYLIYTVFEVMSFLKDIRLMDRK